MGQRGGGEGLTVVPFTNVSLAFSAGATVQDHSGAQLGSL